MQQEATVEELCCVEYTMQHLLTLSFAPALSTPPPTRNIPLLSMQPAFCGKGYPNYLWLAAVHIPCLGMPSAGCGKNCGTLSINGVVMNVTNFHTNNNDVCGTCEGCPVTFVGFTADVPLAAKAFEGKDAALIYTPTPSKAAAETSLVELPACPALPTPWKTIADKQIAPGCSIAETKGSLGVTATAAECFAKAKASGAVNYALWRGDTDKTCDVCAFRWRGSATGWKYSDLKGATSFVWYVALPPPKPSAPCPVCPPNPPTTLPVAFRQGGGRADQGNFEELSNGVVAAGFGPRGLTSVCLWPAKASSSSSKLQNGGCDDIGVINVAVNNDAFALSLDGQECTCSSSLSAPVVTKSTAGDAVSFAFVSPAQKLKIDVTYFLRTGASFLSKTMTLTDTTSSNTKVIRMVNSVSLVDGATVEKNAKSHTTASTDTRIASNVQFLRWNGTSATQTVGAFLTAQNQFVASPSLNWTLDQNWTTSSPRVLDSAIIGLYSGSSAQLEFVEKAAVTSAVQHYLVAPSAPDATVKINIAWCENDYQLDISLKEDREAYKRIIDRAAEMGLTSLLFAPRNSDVSSSKNNTDPWGWEQLLWFGYGQKLRMGEWSPGDPIAASTQELLEYFKAKGVKPVAYVYPILAFLAGTLPNGGSPSWIVQGTYDSPEFEVPLSSVSSLETDPHRLNGVLRSNLANEEFIKWLPETMLAFAEQTGAGGFSFDLTYWEEGLPVASEYAQWAGWRRILHALHTDEQMRCGKGSQCVVDNRQANHGWGAWMWALGGTYAEPLMSDEQPGSWSFFEADLHTDRLAGNKQRQVAKSYRDEYCPNEVLPGFAFHQTDRDPTALQKEACGGQGRCSNHSRVRDFDLLGYRYSLLSSIGTGGLNNVLNMLPARDEQEFNLFPKEDLAFVHNWIQWADQHVALLKLTRPVPSLSTPGVGAVDGTIMLHANNTGVMFLFNPSMRAINVSLPLSGDGAASLGFTCDGTLVMAREIASSERTFSAPNGYDLDLLDCTDGVLHLTIPATSARVLEFEQGVTWRPNVPLLLGSPYTTAAIDAAGAVTFTGVHGESGTASDLVVVLPKTMPNVTKVSVNGVAIAKFTPSPFHGSLTAVTLSGTWAGARFQRAQEIVASSSDDATSSWTGSFTVPKSALDQLTARNASYPIVYNTNPKDSDDASIPWLAPGRLLVFVKYAMEPNDMLNITGTIDGQPMLVRKAYNTIVRNAGRFIGHWADVTPLVRQGRQQTMKLQLPSGGGQPVGVFFDNVETILTDSFVV